VAVLGYNVEQSTDCVNGVRNSFEQYPAADLVFETTSLSFGVTDVSADVSRMKERNVDMVLTCMDQNGVLTLAREMRRQGVDAAQWLPNAYDHKFMEQYGELFEGAYVRTRFAPLETRPKPKGLALYDRWIERTDKERAELSLVGWIVSDMFVTGLRAAGKNFTREKVVNELNKLTDYDAQGLLPGLDWTKQHKDPHEPANRPAEDCFATSQVEDKKFVPAFTERGKPFICFSTDPNQPLPDKPKNKA
jgi:hypothetical protein